MLRERLEDTYGGESRVLTTRRALGGSASLFVIDTVHRSRPLRILGTIDRRGEIIEHSAMDLLRPERLVFAYERLMLAVLALVDAPAKVLLLGLGGGAMWRHLRAYLPDLAITVVEQDPAVIDFARRFFHVDGKVQQGDAAEAVADLPGGYDAVLVDIYDALGVFAVEDRFWQDCLACLAPGGAIAVNWAGFLQGPKLRDGIARVSAQLGRCFFITERNARPNMVQYAPTAPDFRLAALPDRMRDFSARYDLPREDRDIRTRCEILARFPRRASAAR